MDIKSKFIDRKDLMIKFNDAPFDSNNILNPGWAEPTYDEFFTRMADQPVLLNQSTVYPMTALQHDLDILDVDIELDTQRTSTGASAPLTSNETEPKKIRKQLLAQPLQAKTTISDNFIDENIEKNGFMTTYMNLLADKLGPAFQRFGVFAEKNSTAVTGEGSGYSTTDGILAQLKTIASDTKNDAQGFASLTYKDDVGSGVLAAIERYSDQDGNIDNATIVLPPQMYSRLMVEIAQDKDTDLGDAVYQDGEVTKIMGMELKQDNVLRVTRNGYDKMKFTDGEYKGNGSNVDKMKYGFIGQPNNVVFGMMKDFVIKNQWDIDVLGYKVALLCKGDVKLLWDQDTLAIPFTMNNSA